MMAQMPAFSQTPQLKRVFGTVLDEDDTSPLVGATVLMKTLTDSLIRGTSTDKNGKFEFKGEIPRSFKLEISYVGYETYSQRFLLVRNEDLGVIRILAGKLLDEITIEGPPITGEMRGDTAVFNADAFKTRPDADATELIRKLPGVTIEGNSIRAQGETVQNVLVDGRRFFGNDPMTALRNLPAEVVSRVEIFDEQSDQARLSGFDDGTRNRTINIVTRDNARAGSFGRFFAGYGTDDRYQSGLSYNRFKGPTRITITGGSNNINSSNFSGEATTVAAAGGMGGGGGFVGGRGGGGGAAAGGGGGNGITQANSIGLNYSDVYGKNFQINASYFLNTRNNVVESTLARELLLGSDRRQFYDEQTFSETDNLSHRFNSNIEWKIGKNMDIINRTNANISNDDSFNTTLGINSLPGSILLSAVDNTTTRVTDRFNFNNDFTAVYRLAKPGRSISTEFRLGNNNSFGETLLNSLNFNPRINRADTLNQRTDNDSRGNNYNVNLVYTEPLSQRSNLQFTLSQGNNFTDNDQRVFRLIAETGLTFLDSALTNVFENDYLTRRAGFGYRYNFNKLNFNANVNYQYAELDNLRTFPTDGAFNIAFKNVLPTVNGTYRFTPMQNLRWNYRATTQNPSVDQLQDVVNNSNPLLLRAGNPNLEQDFGHFMNLNYTSFDLANSRTFLLFLTGNVTNNFIGNATYIARQDTLINGEIFLPAGGQFTRPENMGGSVVTSLFTTYGTYVKSIKSNVNFNTRLTYSQIPGIVNGVKNFNRNTVIGPGVTVSSNISTNLDFTIQTSGNVNIVTSTLQPETNNNFYNQTSFARLFWRVDKWFISTTGTHQWFTGLGEDFNQSIWLLNAEVGRKLLPKDQGEIKLTVFDALKQNQAISRTVSDISIEDRLTTVLQQYFMVTFTYNLRQFGGNQQQQQRGMGAPGMMMMRGGM